MENPQPDPGRLRCHPSPRPGGWPWPPTSPASRASPGSTPSPQSQHTGLLATAT